MANLHSGMEEATEDYASDGVAKELPKQSKEAAERFERYKGLKEACGKLDSNNLVDLIKQLRTEEDEVALRLEAAIDTLNSRIQTDRERDNVLGLRGFHRRY